jgi:Rrf2 family cysteine metabolism transcriptional repressor
MKLSTKGRYGVRLMIDLASHYGEGPVLLREIAKRQAISEKYLWHLINSLKATGLITATRGVNGGYTLARPPSKITMKEILQASEGAMCLVDCVEKPSVCKFVPVCAARDLWSELAGSIDRILTATTLADMAERQKTKKEKLTSDNYSI